jgi:voltage-gated potassium channel Kch
MGGVVRELEEDGHVTVQTVICGLCLYLLLGLAFAFVYAALDEISSQSFFAQKVDGTPNDFLYFSMVTLTTTGYGDFTAQTELGRTLAVTEALLGQIYLVTVLAVIVSNVRRRTN